METELVVIKNTDIDKNIFNLSPVTIEDFIREGKKVVRSMQCHQAVIAYYAMQVCDIQHGGYSRGLYTMKQYAIDIGLKPKSVQNWTLIYKRIIQYLDIPPEKITKKDWSVASKVAVLHESENRIDNMINGTNRKRPDYKPVRKTPEEIRKAFKDNYNEQTFENEVYSWNATVQTMKSKIKKRDMSLTPRKTLEEFMSNLDQISDFINDYLTTTKNKGH